MSKDQAAINRQVNIQRAEPLLQLLRSCGDYGCNLVFLAGKTGKNEHGIKSIMGWAVKNGLATKHKTYQHWYIAEEEINNETRHSKLVTPEDFGPTNTNFEKMDAELNKDQLYHQMVLGMALYVAGVAADKLKGK